METSACKALRVLKDIGVVPDEESIVMEKWQETEMQNVFCMWHQHSDLFNEDCMDYYNPRLDSWGNITVDMRYQAAQNKERQAVLLNVMSTSSLGVEPGLLRLIASFCAVDACEHDSFWNNWNKPHHSE